MIQVGAALRRGARVLWLSGDEFCTGEMRRQELSGSVQCSDRFVEDRIKVWKTCGTPGVMPTTASMAARQVRRRHRIKVIRAT